MRPAVGRCRSHIGLILSRVACGLLPLLLSGCSYDYVVRATVRDGKLVLTVDPASRHQPACLRLVDVLAESDARVQPQHSDDPQRVGHGTFWFDSIDYEDDCANRFPLLYGPLLQGAHRLDLGVVRARPLKRGVTYTVSTTTGATGYGGGRFVIHQDGRMENLPFPADPAP